MSYSNSKTNEQCEEFYGEVFNESTLVSITREVEQALARGKHFIVLKDLNWKRGERLYGDFWDIFLKKTKKYCLTHLISYEPLKVLLETYSPTMVIGPYKNNDPVHSRRDISQFGGPRDRYNAILCFSEEYVTEHITVKAPRSDKRSNRSRFVDRRKLSGYSTSARRKSTPSDTHIDHVVNSEKTLNPFEALSDTQEENTDVKEDSDINTEDVIKIVETGSDEAAGTVESSSIEGELEIEE